MFSHWPSMLHLWASGHVRRLADQQPDRGAALVEYGFIVILVVIGAIVILTRYGASVLDMFTDNTTKMSDAVDTAGQG